MTLKQRADHYWGLYSGKQNENIKLQKEVSELSALLNKERGERKSYEKQVTELSAKFKLLKDIFSPALVKAHDMKNYCEADKIKIKNYLDSL